MAWHRKRAEQPDRLALSVVHLEQALHFHPRPDEIIADGEQRRSEVQIVPAGFPQTEHKVWLVFTARPGPSGDVRVELATALAAGGERQPLATADCYWSEEPEAAGLDGWSFTVLDPTLDEIHQRRGLLPVSAALLEVVRDRLEQIRAAELEERPDLGELATPVRRAAAPEVADDGLGH